MSLWPNFIGPAYRARSQSIAADTLVNWFPETTEVATEAKQTTYYGTPGLRRVVTVPTLICRGQFSQDGRTWTVVGETLYEVGPDQSFATPRGTIPNDGNPVSIATNGHGGEQLAIVGGGVLRILNVQTNVLTASVTLPLTHIPVTIEFMDGYFLLTEADSLRVWFSALEDGTSWDALDFFAVSVTSSNVVGIKVLHDRLWVFQSQTAVIYYDVGNADNPFVPYPGSVIQEGAVTPWAITIMGESIYWLAQDNQGRNRFVSASDSAPRVISTPPISYALAQGPIQDMEVLAYEQEGHPFIVWSSTAADQSWAYDIREQAWHERSSFNSATGRSHRWRARGGCVAGSVVLVGDKDTGDLYVLDMDVFDENGLPIYRERVSPYLSQENQWLFLDRVEIGIQSAPATAAVPNPVLMLSVSRDSGLTWTPTTTAPLGALGQTVTRAIWRRLGRARADRLLLKLTMTDAVRSVIGPGAWLLARPGSGHL